MKTNKEQQPGQHLTSKRVSSLQAPRYQSLPRRSTASGWIYTTFSSLLLAAAATNSSAAITHASSTGVGFSGQLSVAGLSVVNTGELAKSTGTAPPVYNQTKDDIPLNISEGLGLLTVSGSLHSTAQSNVNGSAGTRTTSATGKVDNFSLAIADLPTTLLPPLIEIGGNGTIIGSEGQVTGDGVTSAVTATSTLTNLTLKISGQTVALPLNPPPNTTIGPNVLGLAGATLYLNEQTPVTGSASGQVLVTALRLKLDAVSAGTFGLLSGEFKVGVSTADQSSNSDTDGDGVPDSADADADGDGIPNAVESANAAAAGGDTDHDGVPDYLDLDSDNDGINDVIEAGGTDANGDGKQDGSVDADHDGIVDTIDPSQGGTALPVPDTDGDGVKDYLDLDSDNDGLSDLVESGNGAADTNNDGVADGTDLDGDGIVLSVDGSPTWGDAGGTAPVDSDGDGIPNARDPHSHGPSSNDVNDAAYGVLDQNHDGKIDNATDADHDGIADVIDHDLANFGGLGDPSHDSDGDGISDKDEGNGLVDTDGDGIPDSRDADSDADGIPDAVEHANAPANGDSDGDGIADWRDLDSDNDGLNDVIEGGGVDANNDGKQDGTADADHDGLVDSVDPSQGGTALPVPDTDGDGAKDYIDLDSDNDGLSDLVESGNGAADTNNDGMADGTDSDGDGIPNSTDGSPVWGDAGAFTPVDSDGDGIPNSRDPHSHGPGSDDIDLTGFGVFDQNNDGVIDNLTDADHDGVADVLDHNDTQFGGLGDPGHDGDGDGIPDGTEGGGVVDTDGDGVPDNADSDSDGDGIPDAVEFANAPASGDSDGDGIVDWRDLDSDNDGINDVFEAGGTDANGDGKQDGSVDADHDGLVDTVDPSQGGTALPVPDSDGDGAKNYIDLDSDNDTVSDLLEGGSGAPDANHDGMVDGADTDKDGIVDAVDGLAGFGDANDHAPTNTDGTDVPDYIDTDSDNAGGPDIVITGHGSLDTNGDGRIDGPIEDNDHDGVDARVDTLPNVFGGTGGCTTSGEQWRRSHFTAAELADPTISGWNGDADKDGIPNAMEYAFGTDPKAPNSENPVQVAFSGGSSSGITLTIPRDECTRSFIGLEYSTDLQTWTNAGPAANYTDENALSLVVTVIGTSPEAQQRLFVRLRVAIP